jgi:hypothetical protein
MVVVFFWLENLTKKKEFIIRNHNMKNRLLSWGVVFSSFGVSLTISSFIGKNDLKMVTIGGLLMLIGVSLYGTYLWIVKNDYYG